MIGWGLTEDGHRLGSCMHAQLHDGLDKSDAEYWRSIGFLRMAENCERRRAERRRLMGWKEDK